LGPIFIFVITMENHGPLHLEKPDAHDIDDLYSVKPPTGCDDLTVYLRHLRNADRMMGSLRDFLRQRRRPARFCWYGDHVPIMPEVYRQFGPPDGRTNYIVWDNRSCKSGVRLELKLTELAGVSLGPTIPELNRRYSM
jgi:phosphoglycerol transferase MdoB-like AlkP superfamily enzyme